MSGSGPSIPAASIRWVPARTARALVAFAGLALAVLVAAPAGDALARPAGGGQSARTQGKAHQGKRHKGKRHKGKHGKRKHKHHGKHKHRRRCGRHKARLGRICVRIPKLAAAAGRKRQDVEGALATMKFSGIRVARGRRLPGAVRRKLRKGAFSKGGAKALAAALKQLGAGGLPARVASVGRAPRAAGSSAAGSGRVSGSSGGWSFTGSGSGDATGGKVAVEAARGAGAKDARQVSHGSSWSVRVDPCPDVSGEVGGRLSESERTVATSYARGLELVASVDAVVKQRAVGHVGDDARLHSYDLRGSVKVTVKVKVLDSKGRRVAWQPPIKDVFGHVQLGIPRGGDAASVGDRGRIKIAHGLASRISGASGAELAAEYAYADRLWRSLFLQLQDRFVQVESAGPPGGPSPHRGWLTGGCVAVKASAAATRLSPGQRTTITAKVSPKGSGGIAKGTFSAGASAGSLGPTSGGYGSDGKIKLTYTAPSGGHAGAVVTIDTSSRQGKGHGSITLRIGVDRYDLVYTHTSGGQFQFPYHDYGPFDAEGTYSQKQDITLSAEAPLTVDSSGTTATGSGPLTWQKSDWWSDDHDTSNSGQDASIRCGIDSRSAVTSTHPGTLTVKSVKLGPPGPGGVPAIKSLDVILWGVGEHWHTDEVPFSGPCPGFPQDTDDAAFLADLQNAYISNPAKWGPAGVTASWASSRYGNLATELVLKAPWSGQALSSRLLPGAYGDVAPASARIDWVDSFKLVPSS